MARFQRFSIDTARKLLGLVEPSRGRVVRGRVAPLEAPAAREVREPRHVLVVRAAGRTAQAAVAAVVFVSVLTAQPVASGGATGGPSGDGPWARVTIGGIGRVGAVGGVAGALDPPWGTAAAAAATAAGGAPGADPDADVGQVLDAASSPSVDVLDDRAADLRRALDKPFLRDDTLFAPVPVATPAAAGSGLLRRYTVRAGDTIARLADRFEISKVTIRSANRLKSNDDLEVGRELTIPRIDGLVVTVREGDTLRSIAKAFRVDASVIAEANGLDGADLLAGQVIVVPKSFGTPGKASKAASSAEPSASPDGPSGSSDGPFVWPVVGGGNYVSQNFGYGHQGLDIAADHGSRVRAATGGTVTFAGWKSNGGGYQVWISHGKGLYTTYNHMSAVSVGRGQKVAGGQQVGRVGSTGRATGPHLHFEVWRGSIWSGGKRVNPLIHY